MKRVRRITDDFVGAAGLHGADITDLSPILTEMIADYGLEERLRTLNLLTIWGLTLTKEQTTQLLETKDD